MEGITFSLIFYGEPRKSTYSSCRLIRKTYRNILGAEQYWEAKSKSQPKLKGLAANLVEQLINYWCPGFPFHLVDNNNNNGRHLLVLYHIFQHGECGIGSVHLSPSLY